MSNEDELNARIYRFPTSAIKQNDRKINYYDFLMAAENEDCNAAVIRMFPRFDMDAICQFIDEVPFLDVMQKRFYQTYVTARCEKIIMPAYEQIMEQRQNQSPVLDM